MSECIQCNTDNILEFYACDCDCHLKIVHRLLSADYQVTILPRTTKIEVKPYGVVRKSDGTWTRLLKSDGSFDD